MVVRVVKMGVVVMMWSGRGCGGCGRDGRRR